MSPAANRCPHVPPPRSPALRKRPGCQLLILSETRGPLRCRTTLPLQGAIWRDSRQTWCFSVVAAVWTATYLWIPINLTPWQSELRWQWRFFGRHRPRRAGTLESFPTAAILCPQVSGWHSTAGQHSTCFSQNFRQNDQKWKNLEAECKGGCGRVVWAL